MKKIEISDKAYKYILLIFWMILILWRGYILFSYCYNYVDDDQAIMWYGTVHFAHGCFPEPCFFGQDYNTMLESLLAVPLYLCSWPLNYALPTVTTILCMAPFLYCSISCYRRKHICMAFAVALLFSITAWQWDVITSVPRSFISGFPFAVIGAGLMCKTENKDVEKLIGGFLCCLGTVMTMSAVAILGIALLYYVMEHRTKWKAYLAPIIGMMPAVAYYVYQRIYYQEHMDDIITKSGLDPLNKYAFELSMENMPTLLRETFGFGKAGIVVVPVIILIIIVRLVIVKKWKEIVVVIVAVTGSFFSLSFGWMQVYEEGCMLFGKSRMVIFWIFLCLEIIMLFSYRGDGGEGKHPLLVVMAVLVSLIFLGAKAMAFGKELRDDGSALYKSGRIQVMAVDDLKKQAASIVYLAEKAQADVLVTTAYSHVMAYGASALYYDEPYIFYVPDKDRRIWVNKELWDRKNDRMLLYSMPVDENVELTLIVLEDQSIPEFFYENYGIKRGDKYEWGIR